MRGLIAGLHLPSVNDGSTVASVVLLAVRTLEVVGGLLSGGTATIIVEAEGDESEGVTVVQEAV